MTVPELLQLSFDPRLMDHAGLEDARGHATRLVEALRWKSSLPEGFPLIGCLSGGTGTGKSTLFNSLAGRPISAVGALRPCTLAAVILVYEKWLTGIKECPFLGSTLEPAALVPHRDEELERLILVDTPDFDSVEASNRQICQDFFILSDVLIFVTSQEKYADLAGVEMVEKALDWGKKIFFVMNKAMSDAAFKDFAEMVRVWGHDIPLLRIERVEPTIEYIPGLSRRPEFRELISLGLAESQYHEIRSRELASLTDRAASGVKDLVNSIQEQQRRIRSVNEKIEELLGSVTREMESRLDVILSQETEEHITNRLKELFRKYDLLFVPRMMIRTAVSTLFTAVMKMLPFGAWEAVQQKDEKSYHMEDMEQTKRAARLEPLDHAVAKLNLQIAHLLAGSSDLDDLREVARQSVPRWDKEKIRSLYDESFPGLEQLLEEEFDRFRDGLSLTDELKLYGSYTAWALFLITAEIIVGGGFSLLDAVLDSIIVPLIPKWLVSLKVIDVLREIGERVDLVHRKALSGILAEQARLYTREFSRLLPPEEAVDVLQSFRLGLIGRS